MNQSLSPDIPKTLEQLKALNLLILLLPTEHRDMLRVTPSRFPVSSSQKCCAGSLSLPPPPRSLSLSVSLSLSLSQLFVILWGQIVRIGIV